MSFNYEKIPYGEIKDGIGNRVTPKFQEVLDEVMYPEKDLVSAWNRLHNHGKPEKRMLFNHFVTYDDEVMHTVAGDHGTLYDFSEKARVSSKSIANATSFPQDYDFGKQRVPYICGMSVPPVMMKRIVTRLIEQGVFDYKKED